MELMTENINQLNELGTLLEEMDEYLQKLDQGCQDLIVKFYITDQSESIEKLIFILEGLNYYQKLLKSAAVLLVIDFSEILWEESSISSLISQLCQVISSISEATENEDYSLLVDLIEYDLVPVVASSQKMLEIIQGRYKGKV